TCTRSPAPRHGSLPAPPRACQSVWTTLRASAAERAGGLSRRAPWPEHPAPKGENSASARAKRARLVGRAAALDRVMAAEAGSRKRAAAEQPESRTRPRVLHEFTLPLTNPDCRDSAHRFSPLSSTTTERESLCLTQRTSQAYARAATAGGETSA